MTAISSALVLLGAPSSIGIRPYDDQTLRQVSQAPGVLRALGLAARVGARDLGDVPPSPYVDRVRPASGIRNEAGIREYSRALAVPIAEASRAGRFVLLVAGECSVVLGALLGVREGGGRRVGLAYIDGHADFATAAESETGSVAGMCLAQAVGRGDTPLARLSGSGPLVEAPDVVLIGRRDHDESGSSEGALREMGVLDLPDRELVRDGAATTARRALERLARPGLDGFWIHLDADVLDPQIIPAVDSPAPGGMSLDILAELLTPLVHHPRALGLELTIYDPGLDPDRQCAERLVALLERVFNRTPHMGGA
jgi:arginase